MKSFSVAIAVPGRHDLLTFEAKSVRVPGISGSFGVLAGRQPLVAVLGPGLLHLLDIEDHHHWFGLTGGFFEIIHDHATILADALVTPDQIHEAVHYLNRPVFIPTEFASGVQKLDLVRAMLARKLAQTTISEGSLPHPSHHS
jgi:F0F1-type ATP synthase epsilon subunit